LKTPVISLPEALEALNSTIETARYGEYPPELYEPIRYLMGMGGKRMRPLLVLLSYSLFADDWKQMLRPAIAVEVFHNFTLMHDDIMDKAPLRRGKPTVHQKWNPNVAILSGDVMLVQAYEWLMETPPSKGLMVLRAFNRCAAQVCEGQQIDMNFESRQHVSEPEYLEMIRLKTAVLIGFSLKLGGLLGDTSNQNLELLEALGENAGMGFQLKDDLLDVYGEQEKFGKQVGGDIIANKKTFLLIEALEKAQGEELKTLRHWLSLQIFDKEEKVNTITQIYNQLRIRELTEHKINEYFSRAFDCAEKINADPERKQFLKGFFEALVKRDS
jgi:geranylgeranyl diphosphate synthase type II